MQRSPVEELLMPAVYVRHLAREFPEPAAVLKGIDLELEQIESPGRYITVGQNLKCVANAIELAESPDWYLPWGLRMAEYIHGPLTPALLTAPTLGDGLDAFLKYFSSRTPYMGFQSQRREREFAIELRPLLEVHGLLPLLIEIPLLILQHYIGTIRNTTIQGARIELGYPAAQRHESYQRWFECGVHFKCSRHALVMPASWRKVPNLGYDEALWHVALQNCEELAGERVAGTTLGRVRNELLRAFAESGPAPDTPNLEGIAERLHLSPRTLIRRLREAGTTFQIEIDKIRQRRATELLLQSDLPISQVASALGFADSASFAKAFRRWQGVSPGAFRRSRADSGPA